MTRPHYLGNFAGQTPQLPEIQCVPGRLGEDSGPKFYDDALPLIRHIKPVYIVTC